MQMLALGSYRLLYAAGNGTSGLMKIGTFFSMTNLRSYDAWGNVLGTNATGRPRGRYVASLGHVQDDESSLIYMRARYYEPGSGRFVSEDRMRDGRNLFAYCGNSPTGNVDSSGNMYLTESQLSSLLMRLTVACSLAKEAKIIAGPALLMLQTWLQVDLAMLPLRDIEAVRKISWIATFQADVAETTTFGFGSAKEKAQAEADAYSIMLILTMWVMDDSTIYGLN